MAAQKGGDFALYIGDAASPEVFTKVGGLRTTDMTLNNESVDITNKDSAGYRQLLEGGGTQSMAISAGGVFTDAVSEETVRGKVFSNTIDNYQLQFGNGDKLEGNFQITSYERTGEHAGEETYSVSLESAAAFTFTPV